MKATGIAAGLVLRFLILVGVLILAADPASSKSVNDSSAYPPVRTAPRNAVTRDALPLMLSIDLPEPVLFLARIADGAKGVRPVMRNKSGNKFTIGLPSGLVAQWMGADFDGETQIYAIGTGDGSNLPCTAETLLAVTSIGSASDPLVKRIARRADSKLIAACPERRTTYQRVIVAPRVLSFIDIGRGLTVASSLANAEVREGTLYSFEVNDDRLVQLIPHREIIAKGAAWTSPEEPVVAKRAPVVTAGGLLFALPAMIISTFLAFFWKKLNFKGFSRRFSASLSYVADLRRRANART
jgi:hypothetical protein